jgi:DNA helicase-2/ATP-dependent DNA helicase PcrA
MDQEKLEKEVQEVIETVTSKQHFLLSGGAGSGKTFSLIQFIDYILEKSPSSKIKCITYTNAAVREINNRFQSNNFSASTIHDFLWDEISQYQKNMKEVLIDIINNSDLPIKNPDEDKIFTRDFEDGILYKEYLQVQNGIISHDEVLLLAKEMYKKYPRLQKITCDRYDYILIDEYQDTSPLVIEIVMEYLAEKNDSCIFGFFGDQMQSIYDGSVGDINKYVVDSKVKEIPKIQNRRNPQKVIDLANSIRTDSIIQEPSSDVNAPNMLNGRVIDGNVNFVYSSAYKEDDFDKIKKSSLASHWNFADSKITKELRLTHNLIAEKAGYPTLMNIYDKDPIIKFKSEIKKELKAKGFEYDSTITLDNLIKQLDLRYSPTGKYKGATKL